MSSKLRVGIAGYGIVGKRRHHFIDQSPYMKVIAVCDQTFEGKTEPIGDVSVFSTYQDLLDEHLDVLFVCLPNFVAAEVTEKGLALGLHVFCEKPPGVSVEEVIAVEKTSMKYPALKLKYGFNHRYHYSVLDALKIIQSKKLGEVLHVRGVYGKSVLTPFEGSWRSERTKAGGGILLDQGIHMVDLMRLFCGDFVEIKSFVSNDFWQKDVEDNAYAIMKDSSGRVAMLHSSATQWQHRFSLEIALSEGYLELKGILSGTKSYGEETLIIGGRDGHKNGTNREETTKYLEDNSWKDEIDEFANAIVNDTPILSGTVDDAIKTMQLVFGIYYADESWRNKFSIGNA